MNFEQASTFVATHGDELQQARLHVLHTKRAALTLPQQLAATQNADGGWAYDLVAGRPSSLHTTAAVLQTLEDLGLLAEPAARHALAWMAAQQSKRGIWRESPALQAFEPPLWMDPNDTAADIYTTALCASTLALYSDDTLPPDRAVNWLQTQQGRDGLLAGFRVVATAQALPAFVEISGRRGAPDPPHGRGPGRRAGA